MLSNSGYIFEAVKNAQGKSIKQAYKRAVNQLKIGTGGRVEDLMKGILSDVKSLSENQVFQIAEQIDKLQKAIDDLAKVIPSLTDSELEAESGNAYQTGDNNTQNNAFGDGDNVQFGSGGTMNKGQTFHQTNQYGSK
jgi:hypothetical protein